VAGVDAEDVVTFTKHDGAVACRSIYEAAAKPHMHLAMNISHSATADLRIEINEHFWPPIFFLGGGADHYDFSTADC